MSKEPVSFSMSLDRKYFLLSWAIFIFVVGLFVGLGAFFASVKGFPSYALYLHVGIGVLMTTVFPISYLLAPCRVSLSEDELVVHKRWGAAYHVPLETITAVRVEDLSRVIRTMGAGGFYGAWGQMTSQQVDSFDAYITRSSRHVILERASGQPLVITPDDAEGLRELVQARISA